MLLLCTSEGTVSVIVVLHV